LQCISTQYQSNGFCVDCVYPCSTCSSITTCSSCAYSSTNQTYYYNGSCQSSCPSGTYGDDVTLVCKTCVFPCQNCLNTRQCTSCISGYLNSQTNTCEICSSKYYADQTTKTCVLCTQALPFCSQCQSSTICKVCQAGYYLMGTLCISQNDCLSTGGYYLNLAQQKCSPCVLPCANCTNSNTCLSCVNGFLYQGLCLFNCPANFYSSLTFMECLQCDLSVCLTCVNNATTCISCNLSSSLNVYYL
jgi:proprotein convertase subtilisin/kexin type 5